MYGLVNQAIREFVIGKFGDEVWERIHTRAGVTDPHFLPDKSYDDQLTYGLVGSVAEELGVTVPKALEVFGSYWVTFVDSQGFGALLNSNGRTFRDFLENLDQFHSRLATAYPRFCPPDFEFSEDDNGEIELIYKSDRSGLSPMMIGIIKGLAKRYETEIEMTSELGDNEATFRISIIGQTANAV
ncbi:MAG: heme NO-binding domain-containing protein [Planctomycetota bacterium]